MSQFKECEKCGEGCVEDQIICEQCKQLDDVNHLFSGRGGRNEGRKFDASYLPNVSGRCFIDSCEWGGTSRLKYMLNHFKKYHPERLIDLSTTENYFTIDYRNPGALLTQFNKANRYNALYRIVLHKHKGQKYIMIQYIGQTDEQFLMHSLLLKECTISSEDFPALALSCQILPKLSFEDEILSEEYLINNSTNISSLEGDKFRISITGFHLREVPFSNVPGCTNCDKTLSVPIVMCKKNHSFCNNCNVYMLLKNKNCKLCDNVITEKRNHNLENFILTLTSKCRLRTASCRYYLNGCRIIGDETPIRKHEDECEFRTILEERNSSSYRVTRRIIESLIESLIEWLIEISSLSYRVTRWIIKSLKEMGLVGLIFMYLIFVVVLMWYNNKLPELLTYLSYLIFSLGIIITLTLLISYKF